MPSADVDVAIADGNEGIDGIDGTVAVAVVVVAAVTVVVVVVGMDRGAGMLQRKKS